jgi:hypothetical protein
MRWLLSIFIPTLVALLHCSTTDEPQTGSAASTATSASSAGGLRGTGGADCDPRPTSAASTGGSSSTTTGGVVTVVGAGGSIDLDGGTDPPVGKLKCWDRDSGTGFDCALYDLACCDKKDVCYDPAREPRFCDRPYCD